MICCYSWWWLLFLGVVCFWLAVVAGQWLGWLFIKLRYRQPGPLPIPLLGNLLHLITSPSPHRTLSELARRYGPLFYLQLGITPTVIVSSPAAAKQILHTHDKSFSNRPPSISARIAYGIHNTIFMSPCNDHWRSTRKFYSSHMFNARYNQARNIPIACEEILRALPGHVYVASRAGSEVNLSKIFSTLVQSIMYRAVLLQKSPVDLSTTTTTSNFFEKIREAERLLGVNRIGDFVPILRFLDRKLDAAIDRCHSAIDAMLEGVIAQQREETKDHESPRPAPPPEEKGAREEECMLDIMLAWDPPLDRVKMKAMIVELSIGGTNTTTAALEWAMTELLNNERVMKKAVEEVDRVVGKERMVSLEDVVGGGDSKMPYIRWIVKETLRLHPPAPLLLPHFAAETRDVTIMSGDGNGGNSKDVVHRIAAGTRVFVNVWAIGRDESTWGPTANQFIPERFSVLSTAAASQREIDVRGQDFGLLPFGSGRRMCPGFAMALPILELTIATFLHCYEWRITKNDLSSSSSSLDIPEDIGVSVLRRSPLHALPTSFRLSLTNILHPS